MKEFKIPEELLEVFKKVNQNVNVKVELGAGLDDLLKDEVPLIKHAEKGIKISAAIQLITNIKDTILHVLRGEDGESDDGSDKIQILKMIAPIFMMQLSGSVDVQFQDFAELVNHPLAAPLQTNLESLIQGMTGASFKISKADDVKIDFDKIKPSDSEDNVK